MVTTTPVKRKGPPPKGPVPAETQQGATKEAAQVKQTIIKGPLRAAQKIVIYGPGGVGKSELASLLPEVGITPVFIDLEGGTNFLDVFRVDPSPETFVEAGKAVRLLTNDNNCDAIVVDSFTKAEELGVRHTLATIPHEKGHAVKSIEGYGFGKGYTHNYETFLLLLQVLDAAARAGKHIIAICHDCTATVPNPGGEDWIRYEPRLQSPPSGKGSIRHRVKEWCDHLFYIGFDTIVDKDGKATGGGSRTIYPVEMPTHWAKSRSLSDQIVYERGNTELWKQLFAKE